MTRTNLALIALAVAIVFVILGWFVAADSALGRVFFSTNNPIGYFVQSLMWVAFFVGLAELYYRYQYLEHYEQALNRKYLPDDPQVLLTPQDMPSIYRSVANKNGELESMIRNLVMRFQAGHSVEQTHEMLNSQLELWQYRLDINYNMIRYLTWLIPTLGFLGTVIGIAITLYAAGSMDINSETLLMDLTNELGMAFYTTLVALLMSAILVFIMHIVQGREESAINRSGQYCLDGLLTRLYLVQNDH